MFNYRRLTRPAAVVGVAALALAACGGGSGGSSSASPSTASGYNAAMTSIVNASSASGGTLKIGAISDCDSWDPQRTYVGACWAMQRLFTRTLMGYVSKPGTAGTAVAPDMATAPGAASADAKTWTYHLQPGLKFDDGTAITTADIKYGIERVFATDIINGGPASYYLTLLDNQKTTYAGPYKDKTGQPMVDGAPSITTPDPNTIVFHLTSPYSDFNYLMALPAAAPVPQAKDTGATYKKHPSSSGPFMIDTYVVGKSISFKRNPNWSQATDTIRTPHVNAVTMTIITDPDAEDKALQNGQIDLEQDGTGVQSTFQAQILADPNLKKNADKAGSGFVRYLVIPPTVVTNVHCRRAIAYALNKSDLLKARGGTYGGVIATTMTLPSVPGYDPTANPYPSGPDNTGDLTKAKAELALCGQPNGFTLNEAYENVGKSAKVFAASQQALARVGITVVSAPGDVASYYSTWIGSPSNIVNHQLGLLQAGWGPDFPTGYGFWSSIVGPPILPSGNTNYASLNDPVINGLLTQSLTATDAQKPALFKQLDAQVMSLAVMIPFVDEYSLEYRAPRLTNVYLQPGLGYIWDFVNVGVSDGK